MQINSARLVVVANSTFIQDNALTQDQQRLDFVSASINWLLSREQMIGIAPKIPQTLTFTLDEQTLRKLALGDFGPDAAGPGTARVLRLVAPPRLTNPVMKTSTTLILLMLVIALGVWIKFFESKKPNTEEAQRQAGNVVNFDREKLEGITIQNGDDRIELRRENGNWRLTAPVKDQADSADVDNLISDIETWRKDAAIPAKDVDADKGRLNEYGLVQAKLGCV